MSVDENVVQYVKKSIEQKTAIEQTVHQSMRQLYLQYLIVGGIPEVVNTFFKTHDLNAVRDIQTQILNSIKDDFGRYKDVNGIDKVNEVLKLRAEACLNSLPAQLSKEYKKFQYSLIVRSYNTKSLTYPLEAEKKATEFKVFYIDTGLLVSQLGVDVPAKILDGDLGPYKGAVAEKYGCFSFF